MSKESDRELRKLPRVDYYEGSDDDLLPDGLGVTSPVGEVVPNFLPDPLLTELPAVADDLNVSVPLLNNVQSNDLHSPAYSVSSDFESSLAESGVDDVLSGSQVSIEDELVASISRLSIVSVSDPAISTESVSSVEGALVDPTPVESEISKIEMASENPHKLVADLETVMFQIEEIHEEMNDVGQLSHNVIMQLHNELKMLRGRMLNVNNEIKLSQNLIDQGYKFDDRVEKILSSSKEDLRELKLKISSVDREEEKLKLESVNAAREEAHRRREEDYAKSVAFRRSVREIHDMYKSLQNAYSTDDLVNNRSEMLRREKEKSRIAAEFDRMRDKFDRLIRLTDVNLNDKEETLDQLTKCINEIETKKQLYEKKVHKDLVDNDLTKDKLKLSESTKIDVGKFSGRLGIGDDFYTFKTKFVKAHVNHPKSLMAELLKNNHLEGHAKEAVGSLDDIDEIWERLQSNFGNTELMLMFHFSKINKMGSMFRQKSFNSKKLYLQGLINAMKDVLDIATEHNLLGELNYGPQLGKIVRLLENLDQNGWYKVLTEENIAKPLRWERMIQFLNDKLKIIQLRAFEAESGETILPVDEKDKDNKGSSKNSSGSGVARVNVTSTRELCTLCNQSHPNSNKSFIQCKKFLLSSCKDRAELVRKGKFCLQCLDGKTKFNDPGHVCCDKWVCTNDAHGGYDKKLHFLLCDSHAQDEQNKNLFDRFKNEVLNADWQQRVHDKIYLLQTFLGKKGSKPPVKPLSKPLSKTVDSTKGEVEDAAKFGTPVFLLQPVPFMNQTFNFMFDSGCQNFVCRKSAVDLLPNKYKENTVQGPLSLTGVGDSLVTSPYGHYTVKLPLYDGRLGTFSGLCLDVITGPMPQYPVGEACKELFPEYVAQGGNLADLPKVPKFVGGETDFLFGQQYNYYQPHRLFILPTGLAIYESMFIGVDGTRGCIGGASKLFDECEKRFSETHNMIDFRTYLQRQLTLFRNGIKICVDYDAITLDNSLKGHQVAVVDESRKLSSPIILLTSSIVNEADEAGSKIDYRCVRCRGCSDCKKGEFMEKVSLKEEFEQDIITKSVTVDFKNEETTASLPFISDPSAKLASNETESLKVYQQQVKQLAKKPAARQAVLEMEMNLQDNGYVVWCKDLTPQEVKLLQRYASRYYMPWRVVFNENSISTPVRIVFDASAITKSGFSLNDLLAKGVKSLNSLLQIFLRFRVRVISIHTDIKKMYNRIKLKPEHWTYQRYWWSPTLDPSCPPEEKIVKTLIYGVKSSGNQAEHGLRETAQKQIDKYPTAATSIIRDTYMDDCATGVNKMEEVEPLISDIDAVLAKGGFSTKGYTVSGRPPPSSLSKDGESIMILGSKWYSESDELQLAFGPISFAKKHRGKRVDTNDPRKVPSKLTKRICLSKVGELFDLCGFAAPIMAGLKLDIHDLVISNCNWDDAIPDVYRTVWLKNFKLMEEIGELKFSRVVVPEDAENLNMELIGSGDASEKMTCAVCYIRFKRKTGEFSSQLILSKTKIVQEGTSLPRAELNAAVLNTHVTEIVKCSLKDFHCNCVYVLDSEITLYWICSSMKQLLPFVRNRVIEILRFTRPDQWYHIESSKNPADIGTRKGVKIENIDSNSEWINGKDWMKLSFDELKGTLLKNVGDIKYGKEQNAEIQKEKMKSPQDLCFSGLHLFVNEECTNLKGSRCYIVNEGMSNEPVTDLTRKVKERLMFSKYLIDPNRFNFNKVVRIFAIVLKCVNIWFQRNSRTGRKKRILAQFSSPVTNERLTKVLVSDQSVCEKKDHQEFTILSDDEIQRSLNYFFQKATGEVRSFVHPKHYKDISCEKNGILYHTGRVQLDNISFKCKMTDAMIDLSTGSFIVPMVEKYSPLSFSIINQMHWYDSTVEHRGVETTIRATMTIAHILGVRDIVKLFKKHCMRCRYLLKKTIDIEMGPLPSSRLCVAPPHYNTQVDLCGPFNAYSKHNKRVTLKVWITVFVCSTTGMTNLKIMEGYDATQFLLAFYRFACEVGFPKLMLADSGSQLVNGCENMVIDMSDLKGKLNREYGIDFKVCPVGGHNFHGKVERKIRTIQETISKSAHKSRLSTLEWETLAAEIANSVNNLPVAIGNETDCLENLDLITPNRLKLGRNNNRSPVGVLEVTDRVDRILQLHSDIFNAWWETWLTSAVPKLVPKPKWFKNDEHVKKGDIVLFRRNEGKVLAGAYKYGIIDDVQYSSDDIVRSVIVKYKNANEELERTTFRAVRGLVVIHRVDEINIMEELGKAQFHVQ